MGSDHQLALFTDKELRDLTGQSHRLEALQMDSDYLQQWKVRIQKYQHQMRVSQSAKQATLFDSNSPTIESEAIDPFALHLYSFSFFRLPSNGPGDVCLYFVLDIAAELVLYIGETCRSNKRWRQHHDCKRYLDNYQSLHYQHGLKTAICMAFWWDAPLQVQARQQMESALIAKFKSPFNKENWSLWGVPFA